MVQRLADPDDIDRLRPGGDRGAEVRFEQGGRAGQRGDLDPGEVERRPRHVDAGVGGDRGALQGGDGRRASPQPTSTETKGPRHVGEQHLVQRA